MIIMKFGGSSIMDAVRIKSVVEIIRAHLGESPVIVFSAMGKVTDWLLAAGEQALKESRVDIEAIRGIHEEASRDLAIEPPEMDELLSRLEQLLTGVSLIRELSPRTRDFLVSFGERLSVRLISAYMNRAGIPSKFFDAWDTGFLTSSEFQNAAVLPETYAQVEHTFSGLREKYEYTPVVTGFIGKDRDGNITTLGRGGSDLTASVLGNALLASEVQVWKDVDGLMTTDPKIVNSAQVVGEISFEEASELAYFGAKILHPQSILPAMEKNIPVRVKNSYRPGEPGTIIRKNVFSGALVKVLTFQRHITVVDIVSTRMLGLSGFLSRVFTLFARYGISVDMIASSEISVSLTLNKTTGNDEDLSKLLAELQEIALVTARKDKAMITVVGNVERSSEIVAKIFSPLSVKGIIVQMISQGASKVNVSFIVENRELEMVVRSIHDTFWPPCVAQENDH